MFKIAADENLHGEIYNRLKTQMPDLDIVRVKATEITGKDDDAVLE